jgi:hypothetical protein
MAKAKKKAARKPAKKKKATKKKAARKPAKKRKAAAKKPAAAPKVPPPMPTPSSTFTF